MNLKYEIDSEIKVGGIEINLSCPPEGMILDEQLGLLLANNKISGKVIYTATDMLLETRSTITPRGDYLLMFPTNTKERPKGGCHYNGQKEKVNDLVAFRSKDKGKTWQGPTIAFDIDYNQHGFIPLIPKGTERIYAFGTQPVWGLWTTERGQNENAPIGYRYSDDDGYHWSEVRLIRPVNDPDFKGMSVMRMCETDAGTWLLGSHEGDWSYRPLMTRQYVLRSEDQGKTWTVLPHPRHGGWYVRSYNRMDEGRPINLGEDEIYMMMRTPEGHLWNTRSKDDGKTWSEPKPTPLVHPDAPPMLFHLSDQKSLAAFHHNRHAPTQYKGLSSQMEGQKDRSEIWVSLSDDGGLTWSEPRFVFANAIVANLGSAWRDYQCSYMDMFVDEGVLNLFVPHRWQRALHLQIREDELSTLPTINTDLGL